MDQEEYWGRICEEIIAKEADSNIMRD